MKNKNKTKIDKVIYTKLKIYKKKVNFRCEDYKIPCKGYYMCKE